MSNLCERIKKLRTELHLSQDYVAKYLEMNRASYNQMENGKRNILAEEVSKLCELFGVSADTLLNDRQIEQPTVAFARSFETLDEKDKVEIMNLINFKKQMMSQRNN